MCAEKLKTYQKMMDMGKLKTEEITPLQQVTLDEICRYIELKGYPPTVKELSDIFKISQPSMHDRINQLVRKGYLIRDDRKARGLAVTRKENIEPLALVSVPIVGTVAAGVPIWAEENITGEVLVENSVIKSGKCFALNIKGDSMIGAGINHGDLIIVRKQQLAENGSIVVALLENEATVKRLRIADDIIELVPENPRLRPIRITAEDNLQILGKVVACKKRSDNE